MPSFTRKAIMEAFMQLLDQRPLNKITIKDVVEVCGINRNTFYYHFEDIPALIEAIVQEKADQIAREHASVGSMEEMLNIAVQSILKNRRAALHIFNSGNRDIYERYLMQTCDYVVGRYLESLVGERKIAREDRDVLVRSYSCWCFGLAMDWMHHGLKEDIQPKLKRLCDLRQGMLEETLARCRVE